MSCGDTVTSFPRPIVVVSAEDKWLGRYFADKPLKVRLVGRLPRRVAAMPRQRKAPYYETCYRGLMVINSRWP
jgi:hypothetical protein